MIKIIINEISNCPKLHQEALLGFQRLHQESGLHLPVASPLLQQNIKGLPSQRSQDPGPIGPCLRNERSGFPIDPRPHGEKSRDRQSTAIS